MGPLNRRETPQETFSVATSNRIDAAEKEGGGSFRNLSWGATKAGMPAKGDQDHQEKLPRAVEPLSLEREQTPPISVKSAIVILNPLGGKGKGKGILDKHVLPAFRKANIKTTVLRTTHCGHAIELAESVDLGGVDALCAVGGDGTLSEIVTGYMRRPPEERTATLGFIPGGTGNAYMREFSALGDKNIHKAADPAAAVEAIVRGYTHKVDAVRGECKDLNGESTTRYSINAVHWGLGTDANVIAERLRCCGPLRYDLGIIFEILRLRKRPVVVTMSGGDAGGDVRFDYDGLLVSAMGSKYTGDGLRLCPYAQLDDGKMDVMLNSSTITSVSKAIGIFDGVKAGGTHVHNPLVQYTQCTSLTMETPEPSLLNFDGENFGYTPLTLEVEPRVLSIFVPHGDQGMASPQFSDSTKSWPWSMGTTIQSLFTSSSSPKQDAAELGVQGMADPEFSDSTKS